MEEPWYIMCRWRDKWFLVACPLPSLHEFCVRGRCVRNSIMRLLTPWSIGVKFFDFFDIAHLTHTSVSPSFQPWSCKVRMSTCRKWLVVSRMMAAATAGRSTLLAGIVAVRADRSMHLKLGMATDPVASSMHSSHGQGAATAGRSMHSECIDPRRIAVATAGMWKHSSSE